MDPAAPLTREQITRQQRSLLAERLFDLEAEVALQQQEIALRDQRIAELEALVIKALLK
jgi:DNA polymerase sigma